MNISIKFSDRSLLILTVAILTCIGLLAIYASSSVPAAHKTGDEFYYVRKQTITALICFFGIFSFAHVPRTWIERLPIFLGLVSVVLLLMVLLPGFGSKAGGATRWLTLGGFRFQPGEIAKVALVMLLAKNLSRQSSDLRSITKGILPNIFILVLFVCLLLLQPDFGTAFLLFTVFFSMMLAAGLPLKYLAILGGTGAVASVFAILIAPYRVARMLSFLDPWSEVRGKGFQIVQSYLAFQNGGVFGLGLGESRQKLFFLPEAHTDFILSVIGEELGLMGVLLVCVLFGCLIYLGLKTSLKQKKSFFAFLAFGLTMMIGIQGCINMGVALGLLPTKGIPLPFVSNGASSLVVFLGSIAIIARLSQIETESPKSTLA